MKQATKPSGICKERMDVKVQKKAFLGLELRLIKTDTGFRISGNTLATILIFSILLSPLLAYSLPETALTRWPYAASFADFVAGYIPAIDKLTALSQFPQVTRLFMVLVWSVVFPLFSILALLTEPQTNHLRSMKAPEWIVWMAPLLGLFFCWGIISLPLVEAIHREDLRCDFTPFDQGLCLASDSRFWLGIFGTAFPLVMSITIVAILRWPKIIRTYYLNKPN